MVDSLCSNCEEFSATLSCVECGDACCNECSSLLHKPKNMRTHTRIAIVTDIQQSDTSAKEKKHHVERLANMQDISRAVVALQRAFRRSRENAKLKRDAYKRRASVHMDDSLMASLTARRASMSSISIQQCNLCQEEDAVISCRVCELVMCTGCSNDQHRAKRFQQHKLKPIQNQLSSAVLARDMCELCKETSATIYCFSCDKTFCAHCNHNTHDSSKAYHLKQSFSNAAYKTPTAPIRTLGGKVELPDSEEVVRFDGWCDNCTEQLAYAFCYDCKQEFCKSCEVDFHASRKFASHDRVVLAESHDETLSVSAVKCKQAVNEHQDRVAAMVLESNQLGDDTNITELAAAVRKVQSAFRKLRKKAAEKRERSRLRMERRASQTMDGKLVITSSGHIHEHTCDICVVEPGIIDCGQCDMHFCRNCSVDAHRPTKFHSHKLRVVSTGMTDPKIIARSQCENCDDFDASVHCFSCDLSLCTGCNRSIHKPKFSKTHARKAFKNTNQPSSVSADKKNESHIQEDVSVGGWCANCMREQTYCFCFECKKEFCESCDKDLHQFKKFAKHTREIVVKDNTDQTSFANADSMAAAAVILQRNFRRCKQVSEAKMERKRLEASKSAMRRASNRVASISDASFELVMCALCDKKLSTLLCCSCNMTFCRECCNDQHRPRKFHTHKIKPLRRVATMKKFSKICETCEEFQSTIYCHSCEETFCTDCNRLFHNSSNKRCHAREALDPFSPPTHKRKLSRAPKSDSVVKFDGWCDNCTQINAVQFCENCQMEFCFDCDKSIHLPRVLANHTRISISSSNTSNDKSLPLENDIVQDVVEAASKMQNSFRNATVRAEAKAELIKRKQMKEANESIEAAMDASRSCNPERVHCDICDSSTAILSCKTCHMDLCRKCCNMQHHPKKFRKHRVRVIDPTLTHDILYQRKICEHCDEHNGVVYCHSCDEVLCSGCNVILHSASVRQHHVKQSLRASDAVPQEATEQEDVPISENVVSFDGWCDNCTKSVAGVFCYDCKRELCQECSSAIHSAKHKVNHDVASLNVDVSSLTDENAASKIQDMYEQFAAEDINTAHGGNEDVLRATIKLQKMFRESQLVAKAKLKKMKLKAEKKATEQTTIFFSPKTQMRRLKILQCKICDLKDAILSCHICKMNMCRDCCNKQHKSRKFHSHRVKPIKRMEESELEDRQECENCDEFKIDKGMAVVYCFSCDETLCSYCNQMIHDCSSRAAHARQAIREHVPIKQPPKTPKSVEVRLFDGWCDNCTQVPAFSFCQECKHEYCQACDESLHYMTTMVSHERVVLTKGESKQMTDEEAAFKIQHFYRKQHHSKQSSKELDAHQQVIKDEDAALKIQHQFRVHQQHLAEREELKEKMIDLEQKMEESRMTEEDAAVKIQYSLRKHNRHSKEIEKENLKKIYDSQTKIYELQHLLDEALSRESELKSKEREKEQSMVASYEMKLSKLQEMNNEKNSLLEKSKKDNETLAQENKGLHDELEKLRSMIQQKQDTSITDNRLEEECAKWKNENSKLKVEMNKLQSVVDKEKTNSQLQQKLSQSNDSSGSNSALQKRVYVLENSLKEAQEKSQEILKKQSLQDSKLQIKLENARQEGLNEGRRDAMDLNILKDLQQSNYAKESQIERQCVAMARKDGQMKGLTNSLATTKRHVDMLEDENSRLRRELHLATERLTMYTSESKSSTHPVSRTNKNSVKRGKQRTSSASKRMPDHGWSKQSEHDDSRLYCSFCYPTSCTCNEQMLQTTPSTQRSVAARRMIPRRPKTSGSKSRTSPATKRFVDIWGK